MSALDDSGWDDEVRSLLPADELPGLSALLRVLPAGYRQQTGPARAARDALEIAELLRVPAPGSGAAPVRPGAEPAAGERPMLGGAHRLVVAPAADDGCTFRLRRFGRDGIELTRTLPLLESFGLVVVEAVPFRFPDPDGGPGEVHIDDIGIRLDAPLGPETLRFVPELHGPRLVDAVEASAAGGADVDSLNRLVTAAALDWRQVMVLRAYLRYWHQVAAGLSWAELTEPLADHPDMARALVAYFLARFDPANHPAAGGDGPPPGTEPARPAGAEGSGGPESAGARAACVGQLDLVERLDAYRVLGAVLQLIDATWRTNYFSAGYGATPAGGTPDGGTPDGSTPAGGGPRSPLVLKIGSAGVPELAPPRPYVDAFVHGPEVEGIHLRAGLVARGGLRWSERPADFRTEVLDLAFAQVKKNAIIVPTGAKGGFVVRRPSVATGGALAKARPTPDQVRHAYEQFVAALLEVTDNIIGGRVVTPPGVVAWDGPDPYLVVAADKGTATYSDVANAISEHAGYWLGDAFASGGSRGYDHKAMGITARGAWVAVRRHFRELGIDVACDPIRVVGVGDMSGDVFGNGMLRSRAIRLVAAFDHRHIFIDPDPDGERSFAERSRLAGLPRSSWDDYRRDAMSPGGGVWGRDTRSVPVSPEARAVLGVADDELSPPELVSAILSAPVDLLWFGGIGTFIKAVGESDTDVADHANDGVRITSDRVRARVVAEGANLGITQRARIRYSRRGGRINADFIDNAAGVATSDREVNLKILLALAIERGRLDPADRDRLLALSEQEVADQVLRQVDHSVAALNRAATRSEAELDAYEALIDGLEAAGRFDRDVEVLPDREEFRVRRAAGAGLIRPELATILAYAKADLVAAVEGSARPRDPVFLDSVLPYFPAPIRDRLADLVPEHRLYPQLVATDVAGELVDQMGIVWAHDLAAELGCDLGEVAGAFWAARTVTGAGELWSELEDLAGRPGSALSASAEAALHQVVSDAVASLARAYLRDPARLEPGPAAGRDRATALAWEAAVGPVPERDQPDWKALDVTPATAERFLSARRRVAAVWADRLARAAGRSVPEVLEVWDRLDELAGLDDLETAARTALEASPPPGRVRLWQARAVLDDISDWRARVAVGVLRPGATDGPAALARWIDRHGEDLRRAAALGSGAPAGSDPLAVASLTLRRLQAASAGD
ncbi:MAG TPA: NAD-glutamate dehydrogenase domain-containing protein [Acidimicrobiales bacterium]|nr:NAD-glutamate dehydrogenase domain-containing protein [Acidimicrobiales bacterium]